MHENFCGRVFMDYRTVFKHQFLCLHLAFLYIIPVHLPAQRPISLVQEFSSTHCVLRMSYQQNSRLGGRIAIDASQKNSPGISLSLTIGKKYLQTYTPLLSTQRNTQTHIYAKYIQAHKLAKTYMRTHTFTLKYPHNTHLYVYTYARGHVQIRMCV